MRCHSRRSAEKLELLCFTCVINLQYVLFFCLVFFVIVGCTSIGALVGFFVDRSTINSWLFVGKGVWKGLKPESQDRTIEGCGT